MLTLGFDTSNYATSLAVFDTDAKEVVCAKKEFPSCERGPARPAPERGVVSPHSGFAPAGADGRRGAAFPGKGCRRVGKAAPCRWLIYALFPQVLNAASAAAGVHGVSPLVRTNTSAGACGGSPVASQRWEFHMPVLCSIFQAATDLRFSVKVLR